MGRSSRSEGYVLRGGRAERLRLLNRVKWPTTEPLLRAAGLRAGMSCLDVGCGSGDVTLKMAALVGAEGNVVGVDRDQSILQLASQEAERQGLQVTDEYHQEGGIGLQEITSADSDGAGDDFVFYSPYVWLGACGEVLTSSVALRCCARHCIAWTHQRAGPGAPPPDHPALRTSDSDPWGVRRTASSDSPSRGTGGCR
jgi:SAM-dependent methyltransferase